MTVINSHSHSRHAQYDAEQTDLPDANSVQRHGLSERAIVMYFQITRAGEANCYGDILGFRPVGEFTRAGQ